ncbi:MAG: hypothetical protein OXT65_08560 [Alphaproteobacteria bacterium]|nr:hypothetical protein [Alphaproteobacteria bacterium]
MPHRLLTILLCLFLTACATSAEVAPPASACRAIHDYDAEGHLRFLSITNNRFKTPRTTTYTLDKSGNITQRTDTRSVVTNYTYDALNRLTDVEYPSDGSLDAELSYDLSTGCGTAYKGKLCKIEDSVGTTEYEYDTLGRVTDVTETRGGLTFTTGYTYDLAGNILTITLDSGRVITYTRNSNGRVCGLSSGSGKRP